MKNKKADEKYYIIVSMIIGIMIVALAFFFIYKEYFTSEELNWETCKQSIQLRASIPGGLLDSAKDSFSLKCKTTPYVLSPKSAVEASAQIAKITAQCFDMFGAGKEELFPRNLVSRDINCVICARISMNPSLKEKYSQKDNQISIANYISSAKYSGAQTYSQYFFDSVSKAKMGDGFLSMTPFRNLLPVEDNWDPNQDLFITIHYLTGNTLAEEGAPAHAASAPSIDYLVPTLNSCGKVYSIPA